MSAIKEQSGMVVIAGGIGSGKRLFLNELCRYINGTICVTGSLPSILHNKVKLTESNYIHFTESQYNINSIVRCSPDLIVFDDSRNVISRFEDALAASKTGHSVYFSLEYYGLAHIVELLFDLNETSLDCVTTYVSLEMVRRGYYTEQCFEVLEVTETIRDELKRAFIEGTFRETIDKYSVIYINNEHGGETDDIADLPRF